LKHFSSKEQTFRFLVIYLQQQNTTKPISIWMLHHSMKTFNILNKNLHKGMRNL